MVHKLRSGKRFPQIGFGVYLIPAEETADAVELALEAGYRLIDTATVYENEKECVQGIVRFMEKHPDVKRSEIMYTTKLWVVDYGYEKAKLSLDKCLKIAAPLNYIDLVLVHSPEGGKEIRLENWKALQEYVKRGSIKDIGISNYGVKHMEELLAWRGLTVKPSVNQIEFNPWLQHVDIVNYCNRHNIIVEAFSPLVHAMRLNDKELIDLSEKYHRSPAQILIRWCIQKNTLPLPKSVRPCRILENFRAVDFTMSAADVANFGDPTDYYLTTPEWDPTVLD